MVTVDGATPIHATVKADDASGLSPRTHPVIAAIPQRLPVQAALLVFPPAATWAGIVTPDLLT